MLLKLFYENLLSFKVLIKPSVLLFSLTELSKLLRKFQYNFLCSYWDVNTMKFGDVVWLYMQPTCYSYASRMIQ